MEVAEFFLKFLIILISAKFFAEIFAYLHLPGVLGEVTAGIILGPSLLGFVKVDATFYLLAEIGILFLLFEVGLETDVGQVVKVGVQSFLVAITGVLLPAAAGFCISNYIFHLSLMVSLFIGGTIVATSIGITVRVLVDIKKHQTKTAKIVLGAAILDDIIGVVILAILYDFAVKGSVSVYDTAKVLGFIVVFLLIAPVITKLLTPLIAKASLKSKTQGTIPTIMVSLILAMAFISHKIGAPGILGSFAAGIALARRFFLPLGSTIDHYSPGLAEKIEENMKPIINLFVPVFFVVVGATINLKAIDFQSVTFWQMAGFLTSAAIITKMISGIWVKGSLMTKLSTGIAMVPRGEVGLIFAEVGKKSGIFNDLVYAIIVFLVALTTLVAPLLLRFVMKGEE
ncbi:MAG: cation:proton antiporter [Candidatus Brocadia sp.]|nr:cation:proton antiporter [Candidatus Brocadia sp.]MDG6025727.1 cation:proton antiporter [Candidatus Brocadia sp.]